MVLCVKVSCSEERFNKDLRKAHVVKRNLAESRWRVSLDTLCPWGAKRLVPGVNA